LPVGKDLRYCVIKAKKTRVEKAGKVYIPEHGAQGTIWAAEEDVIVNYIENEAGLKNPDKALRFSWAKGILDWELQMLIPKKVVNDDDELKLYGKCYKSEAKLVKKYPKTTVDWANLWKIDGQAGPKPVTEMLK
jgi:hypothetical protein